MGKIKRIQIISYDIKHHGLLCHLSIDSKNLINPKFLLKDNNLYIFSYEYTQCYILEKIPLDVVDRILDRNCFILEKVEPNPVKHKVSLIP